MSHVAFATNEDNQSGFNGFPFRTYKDSDLGGSITPVDGWPFGLSHEDVVWMYWKVKRWRVYGDASYTPPMSATNNYSWDFKAKIGDDDPTQSTVTDELQLPLSQTLRSSEATDPDVAAEEGLIGFELFTNPTYLTTPYDFSGPTVFAFIRATIASSAVGVFASTIKLDPSDVASDVTATMTINGTSHTLNFFQDSGVTGDFSANFTIEPFDYWSYS